MILTSGADRSGWRLSPDIPGPGPPKHYPPQMSIAGQYSHSPCGVSIAHICTSSCQTAAWNQGILDQIKLIPVKSAMHCTDDLRLFYFPIRGRDSCILLVRKCPKSVNPVCHMPGVYAGRPKDELPEALHPADLPPQLILPATNRRSVFRSRDLSGPIRGQYTWPGPPGRG